MPSKTADAVVMGGGIIGCAVAYYLSKAGLKVTVLERQGIAGGTTGRAKGVALSHRNVISNGLQVGLALSATGTDRMLHVAPMFHSADLLGTAVTLAGGSHAYLATPTPESFVDALESMKITYTMVPPTILQQVLADGLLAQRDLTALRIFISGGAHVPLELLQKAQIFLPNGSMVHGFGLTETSPILTMMHYTQVC